MYLKEWRWEKGLTQEQLGELLGFSQETVAFAETGRFISKKYIAKITEMFPETKKAIEIKDKIKKRRR